jgi:hypothetical protein
MDYIITNHARVQMQLRKITESDVVYILRSHTVTYPANNGGTTLQGVLLDGEIVRIWVANSLPLVGPIIIKSLVGEG